MPVCASPLLSLIPKDRKKEKKKQQLTGLNTIVCIWLTKLIGRPRWPNCKSSWMRFSQIKRTQEKGAERAERMVVAVRMSLKRNPVSWTCWIAGSGETCCSYWSWRAWGACCSPGLVGNAGGSDPGVGTWPSPAYLQNRHVGLKHIENGSFYDWSWINAILIYHQTRSHVALWRLSQNALLKGTSHKRSPRWEQNQKVTKFERW